MTPTPRKRYPKQRGRKGTKRPLFEVSNEQRDDTDGKLLRFLEAHFDGAAIAEDPERTDAEWFALNHDALDRCLQIALQDPESRERFAADLAKDGWARAAWGACYHLQTVALWRYGLKPWQSPPAALDFEAEQFDNILAKADPISNYPTVLLSKRLIEFGLSVYEPDPVGSLEQAMKRRKR
jgi:hypothetical protein